MSVNKTTEIKRASELSQPTRLSTGCEKLDGFLLGGLSSGGIIEISGESASGKSQLCMQMALTVQYPTASGGLDGSAIIICTEARFPTKRLQEMIENFPQQYYKDKTTKIQFSNNIFIQHIADFESLHECLTKRVPVLLRRRNVKVVIIDSIAAIFRGTYEASDSWKRVVDMRAIGNHLHKLCAQYHTLVLCVNQVTSVLSDSFTEPIPALGLAWANIVMSRFQLFRSGSNRKLSVIFSPELAQGSINFSIDSSGVIDI